MRRWFPLVAFVALFIALPLTQLHFLRSMPGDIGDARFNNYLLENVHRFVTGRSGSLWNLQFFYPFPDVVGFSDNLFGTAPIYVVARLVTGASDTAFQIWFLVGYAVNFAAAYYALRRFTFTSVAATVGSLIFAFALPTSAHTGHAQLHYRFGIPLALVFLCEFFESSRWRSAVAAAGWVVWQLYAGIYMGVFLLLMVAAVAGTYTVRGLVRRERRLRRFRKSWQGESKRARVAMIAAAVALTALMVLLFYPYVWAQSRYPMERPWVEVAKMLPRPQSYLLSDVSWVWGSGHAGWFDFLERRFFVDLPVRYEHQMFIGLVPLLLVVVGAFIAWRKRHGGPAIVMTTSLILVIVATGSVSGLSPWVVFHALPLTSALRAVTRVDQALLFPMAFLAAVTVQSMHRVRGSLVAIGAVVLAASLEMALVAMPTSTKESWRDRLSVVDAAVPSDLPDDAILFIAPRSGPWYADELDAMWIALDRNVVTMNGYSGATPPGRSWGPGYPAQCLVLPIRVRSYLDFVGRSDDVAEYLDLMARIVPVGFPDCEMAWLGGAAGGIEPPADS